MPPAHPVAVELDADIHDRVRQIAQVQHRSPDYVMREAILQYVEREERRAAFRQEGLAAWAAYQATGDHLTDIEADAWLAQLEAGQDLTPPECHD